MKRNLIQLITKMDELEDKAIDTEDNNRRHRLVEEYFILFNEYVRKTGEIYRRDKNRKVYKGALP